MKNKEEKKNRIWVPIVIGALACSAAVGTGIALVHNQQRPKAGTVATMSDAADFSGLTTEVAEVTTTEEATTEAAIEATVDGSTKPEAVPATTEIGGGKKKAEETTEEKKPNTTESTKPSTNHSNGGSTSSGQSTTPKPNNSGSNSGGNSGNSGNSGSSNSTPSPKPSTPATTEAPTAQHQHNYNVWVKTKDAWDETVIDTPEQTIEHPAEYKTVPAVRCNTCLQKFTNYADFDAHATYGGGSCTADGHGTTTMSIMTHDAWTETIPAKTHTVHHDEEGYWACSCGARK